MTSRYDARINPPCPDCNDSGYESVERGTLCPTCMGANATFDDDTGPVHPAERVVVNLMDSLFRAVEQAKADRRST